MIIFFMKQSFVELFKFHDKNFNIKFDINSKEVWISIFHTGNWDVEGGKFISAKLWNNFKQPILAWSDFCNVCSFKDYFNNSFDMVTEYVFKMKQFQIVFRFFLLIMNFYVGTITNMIFNYIFSNYEK